MPRRRDGATQILLVLVQRAERVTLKDDLMKAVWPDTFVEEANLTQNIFLLRKALDEKAQGSRYIVTVPGRGYRFAVKVNETSETVGGSAVASPPQPPLMVNQAKPRRNFVWVGLAILLILGAGIAYRFHSRRRPPAGTTTPAPASVGPRRSVAVVGFHNLSGRPGEAWLSTALSEMLSTELAAGEQLRIVPTEDVARMKVELSLADADSLSKDTLLKLRKNLGSDVVVLGSYTVVGEKSNARIRLDLRLQDALAGETIAETAAARPEADLFGLVSAAGAQLREKLGVGVPSMAEAASVRASLPSNPEAARIYSQGLARMRVFDTLVARNLLQEAVAAEPNFPLSHSALASVWADLGYDRKAREEAMRALSLSGKRSREERLLVEANYQEATKDWEKAVENYRTLFALFPDNLDYGLRLVHAQTHGSKGPETQTTLDALRKLPPPISDDPRIDLAEAEAAGVLSDAKRRLAAASRAADKADAQGSRLLLARARLNQGSALGALGENTKALASFAEAREIFAAAGDQGDVGWALQYAGDVFSDQGDYSQALGLYRRALAIDRNLGFKSGMAACLNNIAVVYENQRDFVKAQKTYELAFALFQEIEDKHRSSVSLGNIAEVLFYRGDLRGAEPRYNQALNSFQELRDAANAAGQLRGIATLLAARGDLSGAKITFEKALTIWRDKGYAHGSIEGLHGLGEVQLAQGDLAGARKTQEEARRSAKNWEKRVRLPRPVLPWLRLR